MDLNQYDPIIEREAARRGIPAGLVKQVMLKESGGDRFAINKKSSAAGLGQFTLDTAATYGLQPDERFQPEKAIRAMVDKLADDNKAAGGDWQRTLYAYMQGSNGAKQVWEGKKQANPEGLAYAADKRFSPWTSGSTPNTDVNRLSNPMGRLQQPGEQEQPLQGAALLQATQGRYPGVPDQYPQQTQINNLPNQAQIMDQVRAMQSQNQQEEQNQKNKDLAEFAANGLAMFIAGKKPNVAIESRQGIPNSISSNWSEQTQNILRGLDQFRNPTAYFSSNGGF